MNTHARRTLTALLVAALSGTAAAQVGQVKVGQLPEPLKDLWYRTKPDMSDRSSCAAAFDAGDPQRMTLMCSVHIRMEAEGRRRSLRRCEEKREELGIRGPCRYVVE